jgi:hypothetical protein
MTEISNSEHDKKPSSTRCSYRTPKGDLPCLLLMGHEGEHVVSRGPTGGHALDPADKAPPAYYDVQPNGCWLWNRGKSRIGYGMVRYGGKYQSAHRAYYAHNVGPIPAGAVVMHTCDEKACVNPDHLKLGTQAENQADMKAKRRSIAGMAAPKGKLTEIDARAIHASDESAPTLAKRYDVSPATIYDIRSGRNWPHLYEEIHGKPGASRRRDRKGRA